MSGRTAALAVSAALLVAACSGGGDPNEAFCTQMGDMASIDERLSEVDLSNGDAVNDALTTFRTQFAELSEVSPDDVEADAHIVSRFAIALADAALESDPDDPFDRAAALAAAAASEPGVDDALERLATYASRNCTASPAG